MVSKWFLGAVSAAGLAAGFSMSAYASSTPNAHTSGYAEVEKLYRTELALGNREQELQFLLKLRGDQIATTARPAAKAAPQIAVAPSRPPAAPTALPSQRIASVTTTTIAETPPPPEPKPTPTNVTLPPTTTTTTVAPTTTTTEPQSDDSGGVDH
jgi:hypothetical protein